MLAAAVATVVVIGAAGLLTAHQTASDLASSHRAQPGVSVSSTVPTASAPQAVVRAFIAAVNARNWRRVWLLGGKNLGLTYPALVAGFDRTRRDVLTSMTVNGDTVSARILAYETTGTVQVYALTYTVQEGAITSGQQTLLARHPARCVPIRHPRCLGRARMG